MFSPRSAMYHLGDDNSMLHGSKRLLIELKACEKALAGYAFANVGGFLGTRHAASHIVWSLIDSKKQEKVWHVVLPTCRVQGRLVWLCRGAT